ncbi:MAG: TatD family hydrolase [Candidatus Syntropharchaeia archaeon]
MIDTHCHLQFKHYDNDRERVIEDAKRNLDAVIVSGTDPDDARKALELGEKYKGFIYVVLGLHPTALFRGTYDDKKIEEYMEFIREKKDKIIGIGEIGLDFHYYKGEKEKRRMKEVFLRFIELSKELNLPVVLHTRNAIEEGFEIISQNGIKRAVFHCWYGNKTLAERVIEEGYYISLATNIGNSKNAKKVGKSIPLDRILTETDAPYLSPEKGKKNTPSRVSFVCEKIAELRKIDVKEVDRITTKNARDFFSKLQKV